MLVELLESLEFNVNSGMNEEDRELSPLQKRYQEYFDCWMKKYGVSSPADLDKETMAKFFTDVAEHWNNGVGPTSDSPC